MDDPDAVEAFVAETGTRPQDIPRAIKNESGVVFAFLTNYAPDWNGYFNS
jgi:hypothetical protein